MSSCKPASRVKWQRSRQILFAALPSWLGVRRDAVQMCNRREGLEKRRTLGWCAKTPKIFVPQTSHSPTQNSWSHKPGVYLHAVHLHAVSQSGLAESDCRALEHRHEKRWRRGQRLFLLSSFSPVLTFWLYMHIFSSSSKFL